MHGLRIEITRFTLVGAANFAMTFTIFFVLVRIVGANHVVSLTVAWLAGVVFSYVGNFLWTFRPERDLSFRSRFLRFASAYLATFIVNLAALHFAVERLEADPFWAQCALTPLVVLFNFVSAKFWSLARAKP